MSENRIDISDLNKADVLAALYNSAKPLGMGMLHYDPKPMTREQAEGLLKGNDLYFDYVKGRVIKVGLKGDSFDPWLYDRDNGEGAAQQAVDGLRSKATAA
jgi:hypothetical protein